MLDWKNPWVLGAAGLALVVLVFMGKGSGSSASLGVASQDLATNANVALAGQTYAFMGHQLDTSAAIDINAEAQKTSQYGLAFGYLANMDNNILSAKSVNAAVNINANNNETLITNTRGNNETTLSLMDKQTASALGLLQEGDATAIKINGDNNATYVAVAPQLAKIQADSALALAETTAQTVNAQAMIQRSMTSDAASSRQSSDMFGLLGNIVGGLTTPGGMGGGGGGGGGGGSSILGAGMAALLAL